MPRVVEITTSPDLTEDLIRDVSALDGVVAVAVHRRAAVRPLQDVVQVTGTNKAARAILGRFSPARRDGVSCISFSEPASVVSSDRHHQIDRESNEGTIEDVASELRKEANPELNFLLLMALSGGVAAAGLWSGQVHLVIGAMVIAPGFEPLLRLPFGLVAGPVESIGRGALATVSGYGVLAVGAGAVALLLRGAGVDPPGDLAGRELVRFWSTTTGIGMIVAGVAGAAGAVTVTAGRAVLTAGVMVALALIPSMAVTGMALALGDMSLAGRGLERWGVDAAGVVLAGAVVFYAKKVVMHRERAVG